jgi:hypothetical protein
MALGTLCKRGRAASAERAADSVHSGKDGRHKMIYVYPIRIDGSTATIQPLALTFTCHDELDPLSYSGNKALRCLTPHNIQCNSRRATLPCRSELTQNAWRMT